MLSGDAPNLTYTPDGGFLGDDSFTFIVSDATRTSNPATVSITVRANTAPVSDDDAYDVDEDSVLDVAAPGVLDGDTDDDGDTLTVVLGTATTNGAVNLSSDGSFTYTPNADYCGADSFTYTANDGIADGNEATVSLDVTCVNDAPVLNVDIATQEVRRKQDVDPVTITATDVDSALTGASLTAAGVPESLALDAGACAAAGAGSQCTWTLSGQATDQKGTYDVTFTVDDGSAVNNTDEATTTFVLKKKKGTGATGVPGMLVLLGFALWRTRRRVA